MIPKNPNNLIIQKVNGGYMVDVPTKNNPFFDAEAMGQAMKGGMDEDDALKGIIPKKQKPHLEALIPEDSVFIFPDKLKLLAWLTDYLDMEDIV